jgi:2-polyprenyl-3-methyl-5-hydroxy-6-metoxy-1,4-benzoquinol methylase
MFLLATPSCTRPHSPSPATTPEPSLFQKLTGEDPAEDKSQWDQFFDTQDYIFGKEPAQFLRNQISRIPVGRALDIAMGEGRNAVFLAKKGFAVEGVDLSDVAIRKAKLLAQENQVELRTTVADLNQYLIRPDTYQLIVNIQYLQRSLVPQIQAGLRPGGYLVFENPTTEELKRQPRRNLRRDYLLEPGELRRLFSELETIDYSEGPGENGQWVARLLARKRVR